MFVAFGKAIFFPICNISQMNLEVFTAHAPNCRLKLTGASQSWVNGCSCSITAAVIRPGSLSSSFGGWTRYEGVAQERTAFGMIVASSDFRQPNQEACHVNLSPEQNHSSPAHFDRSFPHRCAVHLRRRTGQNAVHQVGGPEADCCQRRDR